jgi:hypothetical protein
MAWENFKVEQQKLQGVQALLRRKMMTDLCLKYGKSFVAFHLFYFREEV